MMTVTMKALRLNGLGTGTIVITVTGIMTVIIVIFPRRDEFS